METRRAILLIAALLVHLLFWVSLHHGILDPLFNDSVHRLPRGFDFFAVYQKSHDYSGGASLYEPVSYHALVVPHCAPNYRYLPSWAWVFSGTFGRFSAGTAYWLWVVACELMLAICVVSLIGRARRRDGRPGAAIGLAIIWLCYSPYYLELLAGQFTFMTAGFLTLSLCAFESKREWRGALWLLLSICIKYVGLILLVPLAILKRVGLVAAVAGVVLAIGLFYFVPHPRELPLFLGIAGTALPDQLHAGNLGLMGLMAALGRLVPPVRPILLYVLPSALLGGLLWTTWRFRDDRNLVPLCLLWITAYFLVGPDVYEHHYVLLLPVFSLAYLRSPSRVLWLLYALLALPTVFYLVDIPGLPYQRFFEVERLWWKNGMAARSLLYHSWKAIPVLGLYLWLFGLLEPRAGGGSRAASSPIAVEQPMREP